MAPSASLEIKILFLLTVPLMAKDLGVVLDKLLFDRHIVSMIAKAFKVLDFVFRTCKDLKK